ncbi:hypothetical protein ACVWZV_000893 [Bradyrhizobium sp. GM5.1]
MAEFTGRDLHLVKKALAIAVLTIEREPGPFQSASDQSDMKTLLDDMIEGRHRAGLLCARGKDRRDRRARLNGADHQYGAVRRLPDRLSA